MAELDELLAEADEVIANADQVRYEPVLLLKILVALVRELRQVDRLTAVIEDDEQRLVEANSIIAELRHTPAGGD
jgi:hypothetical protein